MYYQNYPNYPSYQQPNYFNPQQQYNDRISQLQQYQQSLQIPQQPQQQMTPMQQTVGLNGKIVDDFNILNANDVPMDGNGAFFVKHDGTEIQWRNWAANGTIITTSYKPILEQNNQDNVNIQQTDFNSLYEDVKALRGEIAERFDRLEKSITNTKSNSPRSKKETVSEE